MGFFCGVVPFIRTSWYSSRDKTLKALIGWWSPPLRFCGAPVVLVATLARLISRFSLVLPPCATMDFSLHFLGSPSVPSFFNSLSLSLSLTSTTRHTTTTTTAKTKK